MTGWLRRMLEWFSRTPAAKAVKKRELPPLPDGWVRTRWPGIWQKPGLTEKDIRKLEERAGLRPEPWIARNTNRRWMK